MNTKECSRALVMHGCAQLHNKDFLFVRKPPFFLLVFFVSLPQHGPLSLWERRWYRVDSVCKSKTNNFMIWVYTTDSLLVWSYLMLQLRELRFTQFSTRCGDGEDGGVEMWQFAMLTFRRDGVKIFKPIWCLHENQIKSVILGVTTWGRPCPSVVIIWIFLKPKRKCVPSELL